MTPHIPLVADTNSYASVTLGEMRFLAAAAARSSEAAEEDQALLAALPTARLGKIMFLLKFAGNMDMIDTVLRCPLEGEVSHDGRCGGGEGGRRNLAFVGEQLVLPLLASVSIIEAGGEKKKCFEI